MITANKLMSIGVRSVHAAAYAEHLNQVAIDYAITHPNAEAAFIAQLAVESAMFTRLEENLKYTTPSRVIAVFGNRCIPVMDKILGNPQALANFVYANRLGNGDEASGDGWRYRGGGFIQLTGFDNYYKHGYHRNPDLVRKVPRVACEVAAKFWVANGCNQLAIAEKYNHITRKINGPRMLEKERRLTLTQLYLKRNFQ
jgi:putative chitinase